MYQKHFSFDPHNTTTTLIPSMSNGKVNLISVYSDPERSEKSSSSPSTNLGSIKPMQTHSGSSLPPPYLDAPGYSISLAEVGHWKSHFLVVLLPLIPWGIPAHLILRSRRISSARTWLKFLCPFSSPLTSLISIIQVLLTLTFNFIFLYFTWNFFNTLVILGQLSTTLLDDITSILRILTLIIPLNLIWLQGHSIQRLIASFDRITAEFLLLNTFKNESDVKPSYWFKLFILYFAIIVIFTLSWIGVYYSPTGWPYSSLPLFDQIMWNGVYTMSVFAALVFPVYCTFCWAIHHELDLLRRYINYLITSKSPVAYVHLDNIKHFYMKIADQVIHVNKLFSLYFALLIFCVALFLYYDFEEVSGKLVATAVTVVGSFISPFLKGSGGGGDSDTSIPENLSSPYQVRLIVADLTSFVLYISVTMFTYWQAVATNDAIRSLHIWLNDLVTEPQARLPPELHGATSRLKCYIHVRLEQELPALLTIAVTSIIPFLKRRLVSYKVIH